MHKKNKTQQILVFMLRLIVCFVGHEKMKDKIDVLSTVSKQRFTLSFQAIVEHGGSPVALCYIQYRISATTKRNGYEKEKTVKMIKGVTFEEGSVLPCVVIERVETQSESDDQRNYLPQTRKTFVNFNELCKKIVILHCRKSNILKKNNVARMSCKLDLSQK